jgi:hypothetical protein
MRCRVVACLLFAATASLLQSQLGMGAVSGTVQEVSGRALAAALANSGDENHETYLHFWIS